MSRWKSVVRASCLCAVLAAPVGCNKESAGDGGGAPQASGAGAGGSSGASAGANAGATSENRAEKGYLVGRITTPDGKPIATPGAKYRIRISGVSGAGERVSFSPTVKPDGTFKQKLPDGIYHMPYGVITVPFEGKQYTLKLEPVNPTGDRESAEGIVQDFVWKLTGPKPDTNVEINNHTHWYGVSVDCRFNTWRDDLKKAPPALPEGTKLTFTLKPLTKLIDGSEAKTLTVERAWRPKDLTPNDDLNDLPPAYYEVSGVATLPDGSSKPLLLMGKGDYPNFKPSAKLTFEPDTTMEHYFAPPLGWVTD